MFINSSIFFDKFVTVNLVKILALVTVSGNPPLFVIITAQPLAEASKLVLPKGSSQRDGTTAISDLLRNSKTFLCFRKPNSRFAINIIAKCKGSIPKYAPMGVISGTEIMIAEKMSDHILGKKALKKMNKQIWKPNQTGIQE